MSRSNYDKPFYVDVGTSIVAIRCASNHDALVLYDHVVLPHTIELIEKICDRMNKEVEISRPLRNCDVGTADEQYAKFMRFCSKQEDCKECTLRRVGGSASKCYAYWSHLLYKKEGAK